MKRITSATILLAILVSLTACQQDIDQTSATTSTAQPTTATTTTFPIITVEADNLAEQTTTQTTLSTTKTTKVTTAKPIVSEEPEVPIINGIQYENGFLILNSNKFDYLYDISNNQLETIRSKKRRDEWSGMMFRYDDTIYEAKSGKVIFTGDIRYFDNGYAIVMEVEEAFSGNTYSLGVLNSYGEWLMPITDITQAAINAGISPEQLVQYANDQRCVTKYSMIDDYGIAFSMFSDQKYVYSIANNRITKYGNFFSLESIIDSTENNLYTFSHSNDVYYNYNLITGDVKRITEMYGWGESIDNDNAHLIETAENIFTLYDEYFKLVTTFDLTAFDYVRIMDFNMNSVCFVCENTNEDDYFSIMNSNGELAFEPVRWEYRNIYLAENYCYIASKDANKIDYFLNTKTGEIKSISEALFYDVECIDEKTGMLVVKDNKSKQYYLVDPSHPRELISFFEEKSADN